MSWRCPYCNQWQVVNGSKFDNQKHPLTIGETALGLIGVQLVSICCANPDCLNVELSLKIIKAHRSPHTGLSIPTNPEVLQTVRIFPESMARPQPEYIPEAIRSDYAEACRIKDLSPKASATLSRRCLQGMIRDFCGIRKGRLIDEISALRQSLENGHAPKGVSEESIDAIDSVRKIGNIGAHMEKDINTIIDVDPSEAQLLIELIETLFDEWYVERHRRAERFEKITALSESKDAMKRLPNPNTTSTLPPDVEADE